LTGQLPRSTVHIWEFWRDGGIYSNFPRRRRAHRLFKGPTRGNGAKLHFSDYWNLSLGRKDKSSLKNTSLYSKNYYGLGYGGTRSFPSKIQEGVRSKVKRWCYHLKPSGSKVTINSTLSPHSLSLHFGLVLANHRRESLDDFKSQTTMQ